jgi:hypothetical protein
MSVETQVVDPTTGECCDCSQQMNCMCNSGGNCIGSCRSRSSPTGTASFCGFAEFIPSDPPNYYYELTLSGSGSTQCYGNAGCSGMPGSTQFWTYGGVNSIDKNTCAETNNGYLDSSGGNFGRTDISAADINSSPQPYGAVDVYTATTHEISVATNPCVCNESGFACCPAPSGDWNSNLTEKESYDDAINRAVGSQPWSTPGDCVKNSSVTTIPLPGQRVFLFRQAEVQVQVSSSSPGHDYNIIIYLYSQPVGTDTPFVPYGQLEVTLTAPPTGSAVSAWIAIPNEAGLTIAANGCKATDTSVL